MLSPIARSRGDAASLDAVVIGAGFAGLGAAAALRASGAARFAVLEQGDRPGFFWASQYDRLRLHTRSHDMPFDGGLASRYPPFKTALEVQRYLGDYADLHGVRAHCRWGSRVLRVTGDPSARPMRWTIETATGALRARYVAVATSWSRVPHVPVVRGRDVFLGEVVHSTGYRTGRRFGGRRVLVIGSGNSAAEIALDLVQHGAAEVAMYVHGSRHVIPLRRSMAAMFALAAVGAVRLPPMVDAHALTVGTSDFDAVVARIDAVQTLSALDLSEFGIKPPPDPPVQHAFRTGRVAWADVGTARLVRRGLVRVIDGNARPLQTLVPAGAVLGGTEERFDDIVLATGYRPGLEELVEPRLLGSVPWRARVGPVTDGRGRSSVEPTIFFPGFDPGVYGGLHLGWWGWEAGETISRELRGHSRPPGSS